MSKSILFAAAVALPLAFLSANTIAEEEAANPCAVESSTEVECVASEEGVEPVVTCPEAAPAEGEEAAAAPAEGEEAAETTEDAAE